jgi:hypothetical protein
MMQLEIRFSMLVVAEYSTTCPDEVRASRAS